MEWYAVHCRAAKEALADVSLSNAGYETWFPHDRQWEPSARSKTLSALCRRAYFPRYLFVHTTRELLSGVNNLFGVSTVVYAPGGEPFPISDTVIAKLQGLTSDSGLVHRNPSPGSIFAGKPGQFVKGKEGWLHWGFVFQIARICGENVVVLMPMLGSKHREVVIPNESVDIIAEAS